MAHYRAGSATVALWQHQHGLHKARPLTAQRDLPADFAEMSAKFSDSKLRRHYSVGELAIMRWRDEVGVAAPVVKVGRDLRPMPDDFRTVCPQMTLTAMTRHYHAIDTTIRRWAREAGIKPKNGGRYVRGLPVAPLPPVDDSMLGLAKQHLRRFYPNVHDASVLPLKERARLPRAGEGMVIVGGRGAFLPAQVIALAESRGFNPRGSASL